MISMRIYPWNLIIAEEGKKRTTPAIFAKKCFIAGENEMGSLNEDMEKELRADDDSDGDEDMLATVRLFLITNPPFSQMGFFVHDSPPTRDPRRPRFRKRLFIRPLLRRKLQRFKKKEVASCQLP